VFTRRVLRSPRGRLMRHILVISLALVLLPTDAALGQARDSPGTRLLFTST
jgi:hypothetical protein